MGRVREEKRRKRREEKKREEKRRNEKRREETRREEKKKEDQKRHAGARKGRNPAKRWSKSGFAKAAGAEPSGQVRDEKLHAVVARNNFEIKMHKTPQLRSAFRSCDVEKVHAVVARSTFRSQKCKKTEEYGALLEVAMSKKCTPLWREAHFEVKSAKNGGVRSTFGS